MKAYGDFKAARSGGREILPAGGYVGTIMGVRTGTYSNGNEYIELAWDVAEGDHKDFFANDYRANTMPDKKWRGNFRLSIPKDDGSERDGWTKRTFGNAIWAFEESNSGYVWDWNENGLKGKTVGVLVRDKEWEYEGRTGWTTEACSLTSADEIRNGKFKTPKPKPLPEDKKPKPVSVPDFEDMPDSSEDDLPFE